MAKLIIISLLVVQSDGQGIGVIETFDGNGIEGYSDDGSQATNAELSHIHKVSVDILNNLVYIADYLNQ